jgi:glycosyltransferase involved in cell wall biosynthesis
MQNSPPNLPSNDAPSLGGAVDVVIPVRNGARTILQTLTSILGQTVTPGRIIVVDDGSTDDTVQIVANVGSDLIELVTTPPVGASHARNRGIEASRAEFIAFLDADDLWHPDKLQRQLQVFAADPDASVVYCGYALLRPSGAMVEIRSPSLRGFVFDELLKGGFVGNSSSLVVRRETLRRIGGYDESLGFAEDTDLHLHLAQQFKFNFAEEILAYVIENPDSTTRRPASMKTQEEFLLQNISMYEKRCPHSRLPHRVLQNLRKRILYLALRRIDGWRWMLQLRAQPAGCCSCGRSCKAVPRCRCEKSGPVMPSSPAGSPSARSNTPADGWSGARNPRSRRCDAGASLSRQ